MLQALMQLAAVAQTAHSCSCTALSIICTIIQRHLPSATWTTFLQEAGPLCITLPACLLEMHRPCLHVLLIKGTMPMICLDHLKGCYDLWEGVAFGTGVCACADRTESGQSTGARA